jgi:tetratricopeptide (TPR) repeat protein
VETIFNKRMKRIYYLLLVGILPFGAFSQNNMNVQDSLRNTWESSIIAPEVRMEAAKFFYTNYSRISPNLAINALEVYVELAIETNDSREEAGGLVNLGNVFRDLGKYNDAQAYYENALVLATELQDFSLSGVIEANIGNLYNDQGNLLNAFRSYRRALNIFKDNADTLFTAYMYSSIGEINLQIENYELAESNYLKALEVFSALGVKNKIVQMNMARMEYERGHLIEAKALFKESLKQVQSQQDYVLEIGCYQYLAKINRKLRFEDKSLLFAKEALRLAQDFGNPYLIEEARIEVIENQNDIDWLVSIQGLLLGQEEYISNRTKERVYRRIRHIHTDRSEFEKTLNAFDQEIKYKTINDSIRFSHLLIAETIVLEEEILFEKERSRERIEVIRRNIQLAVSFICIILGLALVSFFLIRNSTLKRNKLLEQIQQLKRNQNPLVLALDNQVNLNRELLEYYINQKLNKTDWNVLNELVQDPIISNKMIAEKIFLSVEGVSSSLRRMYIYFDINDTRYKKIALVMKAIQVSKQN